MVPWRSVGPSYFPLAALRGAAVASSCSATLAGGSTFVGFADELTNAFNIFKRNFVDISGKKYNMFHSRDSGGNNSS